MGFLESWYEDNISGKDGEYKGRGFGAAILKPFVDEDKIEGKVQSNRNKQTATAAGYGGVAQMDPMEQYVQQLIAQGYPEETARTYAQQYAGHFQQQQ